MARNLAHGAASLNADALQAGVLLPIPERLGAPDVHEAIRSHSDFIQEIAVHVLDFRYIFASRDQEYVDSIWSSWSLVPSVVDRVDRYVLRTLCALSVAYAHLPIIATDLMKSRSGFWTFCVRCATGHSLDQQS